MEPRYLHDNDSWMLGEEIPNADLFFSSLWFLTFTGEVCEKNTGRAYHKILCKYEGYHLWFYFGEQDSFEVGEVVAKRIVKEPGYAELINKNILIQSDKLRVFSETIPQTNLEALSDENLWFIYLKHNQTHSEYYTWGWIPVAADMFHGNLTKRVKEYLFGKGVAEDKVNEYLVTLTQPTKKSLIFIEQEELLHIAEQIVQDEKLVQIFLERPTTEVVKELPENIFEMVREHWKKYYYTKHIWVSGEYTIDEYIQQLKDIFATKQHPSDILRNQAVELDKAKEKRESLLQVLKIEGQWRSVLDAFGDFMITKIYRRYAQLLAIHHMSPILREIACRRFITEKQVRFMRLEEVKHLLLENVCDEATLLERTKFCVYYAEREYEGVFIGKKARELSKTTEREIDKNITEIRGETGCVGYAKGKVKIIIRAEDMNKMEKGDILVSIATDPDIVPAMKKAAGIVTEQGGVTSHAAIVSREMGIPCVIGTRIATKVFKDGDTVEVDANRGIVRKL